MSTSQNLHDVWMLGASHGEIFYLLEHDSGHAGVIPVCRSQPSSALRTDGHAAHTRAYTTTSISTTTGRGSPVAGPELAGGLVHPAPELLWGLPLRSSRGRPRASSHWSSRAAAAGLARRRLATTNSELAAKAHHMQGAQRRELD